MDEHARYNMVTARAVLIRLMERYLAGVMDPFVSPARGAQADVLHAESDEERLYLLDTNVLAP